MSRLHLTRLLLTCFLLIPAGAGLAQQEAAQIDALLQQYHDLDLLNGAVLVAHEGEVIYEKGFGHAQMSWDIPNTPETRFRIGSVTKQFTAALILQLVEEGLIDLQADIATYIPAYPDPQGSEVTIHQLLTHTSGIPSYTSFPDFQDEYQREPYEPDSFLSVFWELPYDFEPGSRWSYNNSGYFLLGVVIEKVTGQPYDRVLQERILDPLGLDDTGYDHYGNIIEHRATGYVRLAGGYEHAPYLDTSIPYSAGMMYSTVRDLYEWDQHLYEGGPFDRDETMSLMLEPHAQIDDGGQAHYAYGWFLRDVDVGDKSVRIVEHGGGIHGFSTAFYRMPEERNTVIVMDNTASRQLGDVVGGIVHILYGEEPDPPKQPIAYAVGAVVEEEGVEAAVAHYRKLKEREAGRYTFAEQELNRLGYYYLRRGDTDTALRLFQLNVEEYPEAPNTYDSLGEAYLEAGDEQEAIRHYTRSLELNPGNENARNVLKRLGVDVPEEEIDVPEDVLERYVGRYELGPGFVLEVTKEGTQMFVQATGQPRNEIFPKSEHEFYLKVVPAQITFHRGEGGNVGSLTLHQGGRDMEAQRIE